MPQSKSNSKKSPNRIPGSKTGKENCTPPRPSCLLPKTLLDIDNSKNLRPLHLLHQKLKKDLFINPCKNFDAKRNLFFSLKNHNDLLKFTFTEGEKIQDSMPQTHQFFTSLLSTSSVTEKSVRGSQRKVRKTRRKKKEKKKNKKTNKQTNLQPIICLLVSVIGKNLSQRAGGFAYLIGIYLMSCGASVETITVLNKFGVSMSYKTLHNWHEELHQLRKEEILLEVLCSFTSLLKRKTKSTICSSSSSPPCPSPM